MYFYQFKNFYYHHSNTNTVHYLPTDVQVLEVVRSNYDTLTLKLHDSLDHFEKYAEKPKETTFFTHLVSGGCSQNARMPELYIMTTCRLVNYKSAKIHNPCDSMVYPRNFQIM